MNSERQRAGWRSLSPLSLARRLHRDERGSLSVMGVFAVFFLTVLLGMIFNVGRQVDDKLRMQNAADAAAYSGTLTAARGMNAIAYSNHLLCEVFALTAYMREARLDPNSTELPDSKFLSPDVLETWHQVASDAFVNLGTQSGLGVPPFDKFVRLGEAILDKIPLEREMVRTFEPMAREHSRLTLSLFEYILRGQGGKFPVGNYEVPHDAPQGGLITRFQRSVMRFTPEISQRVAQEIVRRHGRTTRNQHRGRDLTAVMYRTDASRFDEYQEENYLTRLLPMVDPTPIGGDVSVGLGFDPQLVRGYFGLTDDQIYFKMAYDRRTELAKHYLEEWIYFWMDHYFTQRYTERRYRNGAGPYGRDLASLSQLANFWRIFTCAQLNKLLHEEFPKSNLPFVIRVKNRSNWQSTNGIPRFIPDQQALQNEYHCVAVVAWPHTRQFGPGIYRNPLNGNKRTVADDTYALTFSEAKFFLPRARYRCCPWVIWYRRKSYSYQYDNWPAEWSSFNQNWRTKLVPAWTVALPAILARHPGGNVNDLSTPNLRGLTVQEIHLLNSH